LKEIYHEGITPYETGVLRGFYFCREGCYMRIAVVDGQGGGIGKLITEKLRKALGERVEITALGTNALATAQMLKAGADQGASGENAICVTAGNVDIIMGPIAIILANSMLGEVTPKIAANIAGADAEKILMPLNKNNLNIVGLKKEPMPHLVEMMVERVREKMAEKQDHEGSFR
jgi:hypothetical protein